MDNKTIFKVGDTIYVATHGRVNQRIIRKICHDETGIFFILEKYNDQIHQDFARDSKLQAQDEADQQIIDSRKSSLDQIKMRHKSNAILLGLNLEWVNGTTQGIDKSYQMYKHIAFHTAKSVDSTITEEQIVKAINVRNSLNIALASLVDSDIFSRVIVEEFEKNKLT